MIKIMANENDNDWQTNVAVTDETVRVTKKFLEEHPEEIKNSELGQKYTVSKEAFKIGSFLNWSETKVYNSPEKRLILSVCIERSPKS